MTPTTRPRPMPCPWHSTISPRSQASATVIVPAGQAIGFSILAVSLLEPAYQAFAMASSGRFPTSAAAYVGVLVFLFNFFQLHLFERYDFFSMYAFRLAYYLVWRVAWGSFRLHLLF